MSCGQIALDKLGIKVNNYFASEIDKYAIQVTKHNYPNTKHIGEETKPKYFLLENVRMKKEYQDIISKYLGCEPVIINSALVSAQNRVRLFWTNIPGIEQPKDKGIYLSDIIESGIVDRDKSYCIDANYHKGGNLKQYFEKSRRQLVFCGEMRGRYIVDGKRQDGKMKTAGLTTQRMEIRYDGKTNTITTVQKDEYAVFIDGFRKLTPTECERLQTVPYNYTSCVSNTQRYRMLGNGWTVDVIVHIFNQMAALADKERGEEKNIITAYKH